MRPRTAALWPGPPQGAAMAPRANPAGVLPQRLLDNGALTVPSSQHLQHAAEARGGDSSETLHLPRRPRPEAGR